MSKQPVAAPRERKCKPEPIGPSPAVLRELRESMVDAHCAADIAWKRLIQGVEHVRL